MPTGPKRLFALLNLLLARDRWRADELAARLEVSTRTLRRDLDVLRDLGYAVEALQGPDGGYRMARRSNLPPLVLDTDQAIAIAVALRTTPHVVAGIEESVDSALEVLRQAMPPRHRVEVDAFGATAVPHAWDFPGTPVAAAQLRAVGLAVHRHELLDFDHARADGSVPDPHDPDFQPPVRLEPHELLVWAGRWYVHGYRPDAERWVTFRVDRMRPRTRTGLPFEPRPTSRDVAEVVREDWDRGDTLAAWPCRGSATLPYPPEVVARWAPGGSVVEPLGPHRTRLRLGAWSWEAVAGLLATFACPLEDVEPADLVTACHRVAGHLTGRAAAG